MRRCYRPQCSLPGEIWLAKGSYACRFHADEIRSERAAIAALTEPAPTAAEVEHATAQARNSNSFLDLCPGLQEPAELARHVELWRSLEENK